MTSYNVSEPSSHLVQIPEEEKVRKAGKSSRCVRRSKREGSRRRFHPKHTDSISITVSICISVLWIEWGKLDPALPSVVGAEKLKRGGPVDAEKPTLGQWPRGGNLPHSEGVVFPLATAAPSLGEEPDSLNLI